MLVYNHVYMIYDMYMLYLITTQIEQLIAITRSEMYNNMWPNAS